MKSFLGKYRTDQAICEPGSFREEIVDKVLEKFLTYETADKSDTCNINPLLLYLWYHLEQKEDILALKEVINTILERHAN